MFDEVIQIYDLAEREALGLGGRSQVGNTPGLFEVYVDLSCYL